MLLRQRFKMFLCIKIETASLIFAILSLLATSLGSVAFSVLMVRLFIKMNKLISEMKDKKNEQIIESWVVYSAMRMNILLAIILSILVIGFTFSIILTKGLISKNFYLVKTYFVYGVTGTTLAVLLGLYITLAISLETGLLTLLGCFVYILILMIIKKTYLKLAKNNLDQKCQKDVVEEETISVKL